MINRIRTFILSAFVVSIPLCYLPDFSRKSQEDFFQYASIILVASFIGNVWLSSFLTLNVVLYIINGASVGNEQVLNVLFGCLAFAFSRFYFKHNKFESISRHLMIVVAVTLVFMAMQMWHIGWMFWPRSATGEILQGNMNDPIGFFGIKEANGTFLTLVWPIVAGLSPICALLLTVPIKLSQSSSVYLAFGSVVLFYTYYLHRKIFKILLFVMPILAGIYIIKDLHTDPKTFTSRFPVWHSTVETALHRPIGYGPDSYRNYTHYKNFKFVGDNLYNHALLIKLPDGREVFKYYSVSNDRAKIESLMKNISNTSVIKGQMDEWDNPHSMPINILFQYGILGLFLFGGLIREVYFRFKWSVKDKETVTLVACLIVYLITGLTHFPLELARTGYLAAIILGAFYAKTDDN